VRLRFGDVEFDSESRQIRRTGSEVHVSVKAFDLLTLLLERRPRPVSKSEIRERLWSDTFVSDANLPTLIAEIRGAIGDNGKRPRFVRTLHRIGYAFQGDVVDLATPTLPATEHVAAWLIGHIGRIGLNRGENVLGRHGDGIVILDSATVSRHHARITVDDRGAAIEDLGSKNGTYVNDRRITETTRLVDGDGVRTGMLSFTFRMARAVASTETL
jgi:DNA-binding winged helix-turn-helix (wHTH) protein